MKQIVVISGKGGTGKTVITAAFAALARNAGFADCDVDAADLHLLLMPEIKERYEFKSGRTAIVDKGKCIGCNKCIEVCRFGAIYGSRPISRSSQKENRELPAAGDGVRIDPISCEGCAFCSQICPVSAIKMRQNISGKWFISNTRFGPMVHAKLGIAEENSGKLVTLVRQKAKEIAQKQNCDWVIVDGPPGIGCPVIASLSGVNCAIVVTEPTLSGLHDADRVIDVAKHFGVPVKLIINKYDLNINMTGKIEKYCKNNNISLIGKISFDSSVVKAMVEAKTIMEYSDGLSIGGQGKAKEEISKIWASLREELS